MKSIEKLEWRYAVKSFDPSKKLSDEKLDLVLNALRLSASSFGLQPWKFVVVKNPTIRAELQKYSWNQPQVVEASHLIVLCSLADIDSKHLEKNVIAIAKERGLSRDSLAGFEKMITGFVAKMDLADRQKWMRDQVYLALGNLLTVCAYEGIDSCPMEGFSAADYDRVLGLEKKGLKSVVVVPLGYRNDSDKYSQLKKVRFPLNEVIEYVE